MEDFTPVFHTSTKLSHGLRLLKRQLNGAILHLDARRTPGEASGLRSHPHLASF
jgi:hypothetical protein